MIGFSPAWRYATPLKTSFVKGGYGSVYLATDLRCIGTRAAVKELSKVTHVTILIIDCLLDHLGRIRGHSSGKWSYNKSRMN